METVKTNRPLRVIAREIQADWKRPYFGAKPYIDAMTTMDRVSDNYGLDPGRDIVLYFLANANTWRGETARRVKAELKAIVKEKEKALPKGLGDYESEYDRRRWW